MKNQGESVLWVSILVAGLLGGLLAPGVDAATKRAPIRVAPAQTFTGSVIVVSRRPPSAVQATYEARYAENPYQQLTGGIVFTVTECDMDAGCLTPVVTFANSVTFSLHIGKLYYIDADVMGAHGMAYFTR